MALFLPSRRELAAERENQLNIERIRAAVTVLALTSSKSEVVDKCSPAGMASASAAEFLTTQFTKET